ncbi:putative membrane protein YphA (DoxX/SURF4 family) [Filimonas zeae]|uniref:Thioredoxin domain-containing protein n=1 Tax=Filimonas zeae TaxID=1737353 RepID=A0A917MUW8_9BACT|nr:MauE/DoxX family redox-associated membrane protein [Filimonas zeae]MDR6338994.1 putative membrane protein YphA (DoxX/SURF4 family) [Filimonas zeae]GGH65613.1 hypothetical protein GCM10011379_18930 [Filimonas zeae]
MKKWIIEIICLLYILLFMYAALSKLIDYQKFTEQLQESPLKRFAGIVAWITPATEILLSILLFIHRTRKAALFGSFLLMMGFTVYIIYILKYASDIPCSCGGILENMNWTQHLIFNIAFTLLALVALILHKKNSQRPLFYRAHKFLYGSMGTVILILIVGAISVASTGTVKGIPPKAGDPIPPFSLLLMDSATTLYSQNIPTGTPIVLSYFQPDCSHCQAELIEITQKRDSAQQLRFYFITSGSFSKTRFLYRTMQLQNFPYITMGVDTARSFFNHFRPKGTPYQQVYSADKVLISIIPNQSSLNTLVSLAKQTP